MIEEIADKIVPAVQAIRLYHQHEVIGMDNIPKEGPALIAVNHSFATYDILLLFTAVYVETRRITRPLIDRLFFKVPGVGELMKELGATQGSPTAAQDLLKEGHMICVAPGGMREALRPSSERYQILWDRRLGFAKVALKAGVPVILAACPKADDIYELYENPLTKWVYQTLRVPFAIARGVGLSPVPRPVKLRHFIDEPIMPPKASDDPDEFDRQLVEFHAVLVERMQKLMARAVSYRPKKKGGKLPPAKKSKKSE